MWVGDVSALMGYPGAMMKDLLGTVLGASYGIGVLALWMMVPLSPANWIFRRKNL